MSAPKKKSPPLDGSKQRPFAAAIKAKKPPAAGAIKEQSRPAPATAKAAARRTTTREPVFADLMRDAKPLAKRVSAKAAPEAVIPALPTHADADDQAAREELAAFVSEAIRFEVLDDGGALEGRRLDVDPRELRRLRQLSYSVDGKLDLHGHNVASARQAVERFLARRRSQGDRAILIIHGRGIHAPRGEAILRGELGAWLSQGEAARHVLAFASVSDNPRRSRGIERQSGCTDSGAVFVLLAKR